MTEQFLLSVALATSEVDELVAKGPIDFDGFVRGFREFDWPNEIVREFWNRKSTPAMGVTNKDNGATLWTYAWDWLSLLNPTGGPAHTPALSFVVGLNDGPAPPDIYCRKEDRALVDCEFVAETPDVVEDLFALHFRESYDDLYKQLFSLRILDTTRE